MKKFLSMIAIALFSIGLTVLPTDSDARRLGGGGSFGKQRTAPASTPSQPAATNSAAQSTAAAGAAKPGFMQRWGGMIAGLGMGALLGAMLGGMFGSGLSTFITLLLVAAAVFLLFRYLAARKRPAGAHGMQYAGAGAGAGSATPPFRAQHSEFQARPSEPARPGSFASEFGLGTGAGAAHGPAATPVTPSDPETAALLRLAQTAFIRLQAANDARDLDDIRSATTPEVFAELATQMRERGDADQYTEVVSLNAELIEMVVEDDFGIFSVRYTGMIREERGAEAQPFNEIWHMRRNMKDPQAIWLIAGIQQGT